MTIEVGEDAAAPHFGKREEVAILPKPRGELRLAVLSDHGRVTLEVGFWVEGHRVARSLFRENLGELDALEDALRVARETQRASRRARARRRGPGGTR